MEGCNSLDLAMVDWNDGMPGMVEWNGLECRNNGVLWAHTHTVYTIFRCVQAHAYGESESDCYLSNSVCT